MMMMMMTKVSPKLLERLGQPACEIKLMLSRVSRALAQSFVLSQTFYLSRNRLFLDFLFFLLIFSSI